MRKDKQTLSATQYLVGAKADGVRAFMIFSFIEEPEFDYTAVVDRAGSGTMLNINAPLEFYSGTLLDGEMVTDEKGDMTYHVFDIIALSGYTMVKKSHSVRRGEMKRACTMLTSMNPNMTNLKIVEKKWFTLGSVNYSEIVESIRPSPCDGLIFVPEQGRALTPGRQVDHFKWKTAIHHTVDFIIKDNKLFVGDRGGIAPAEIVNVTAHKNPTDIAMTDGTVVECKMTKQEGNTWVAHVLRVRHDKRTANDHRVVSRTLQNIEENILIEELI